MDNNVTRHVAPELAKEDWDGLIFHYLGLDHVGHSGGPKSSLMRPKQAEMDSVAQTIYTTLVKKDTLGAKQQDDLPTLFVLCGDHGMNEVHIETVLTDEGALARHRPSYSRNQLLHFS